MMTRALVAIAVFCAAVSAQDASSCTGADTQGKCSAAKINDDEVVMLQTGADGTPLAMAQEMSETCLTPAPVAAQAAAVNAAKGASQAAVHNLTTIAMAEYNNAIGAIAEKKKSDLALAKKAFELQTQTTHIEHYKMAIHNAALKQQARLFHDMKLATARRAREEAEAVAHTKLKMEDITRKHVASMDLANGLAKRAAEQGQMDADESRAADKKYALQQTREAFEGIMKSHQNDIKKIRAVATKKIAALNVDAVADEVKRNLTAVAKKKEMDDEAMVIYKAEMAKAIATEKHMIARAASKKKVLIAEATNGATNAANQAWLKTFADEMSFGAPCQASKVAPVAAVAAAPAAAAA